MCYTKPFDYTYLKEKSSVLKSLLHTKSLWNATPFEFSTKKIFTLNVLYKTLHMLDKMLGKVILFSLRKQTMIILYCILCRTVSLTALPDRMLMLFTQIRKFAAILPATIPHLTSSPGNNTFHLNTKKRIIVLRC